MQLNLIWLPNIIFQDHGGFSFLLWRDQIVRPNLYSAGRFGVVDIARNLFQRVTDWTLIH